MRGTAADGKVREEHKLKQAEQQKRRCSVDWKSTEDRRRRKSESESESESGVRRNESAGGG